MDYRDLLKKYNLLLDENRRLIKENDRLKAQLGIPPRYGSGHLPGGIVIFGSFDGVYSKPDLKGLLLLVDSASRF